MLGIDVHHLPSVPTWHTRTTVLTGDAAHAASPASAQGASMAAEDGAILAKCLRDSDNPEHAFRRYESLRRPRAEGIVTLGAHQGAGQRTTVPTDPYQHHIDWHEPTTPA